jgi:hypothetical protein
MPINDRLKELLSVNQNKRLAEEKARENRRDNPKILRHTTYQGDRKIQQLGDDIIENAIVLNNQAVEIGGVMLPLAQGNVLRRVDNTNGGALLGSAYRDVLANNFDANGNLDNLALSRNGVSKNPDPFSPNNPNNPNPDYPQFPPPFGCTPPPSRCFWTTNPVPPNGFQSHGSAVINENAVPLYLHCVAGTAVPLSLNCEFLKKWKCNNGICTLDDNGTFGTQAECESNTYFIQVVSIAKFTVYGCVNKRFTSYFAATSSTTPNVVPTAITDAQCGGTIRLFEVYGSDLGLVGSFGANTVTASIIRACSIPADTEENI